MLFYVLNLCFKWFSWNKSNKQLFFSFFSKKLCHKMWLFFWHFVCATPLNSIRYWVGLHRTSKVFCTAFYFFIALCNLVAIITSPFPLREKMWRYRNYTMCCFISTHCPKIFFCQKNNLDTETKAWLILSVNANAIRILMLQIGN